jgi:hypothetical protein
MLEHRHLPVMCGVEPLQFDVAAGHSLLQTFLKVNVQFLARTLIISCEANCKFVTLECVFIMLDDTRQMAAGIHHHIWIFWWQAWAICRLSHSGRGCCYHQM